MNGVNSRLLTINGGSSTIKFALFDVGSSLQRVIEGNIVRIGLPDATFEVKGLGSFSRDVNASDYSAAVNVFMDWLENESDRTILSAVGHRVVHGGPKYYKPQPITEELVKDLQKFSPFDPQHMAEEILLIEAFQRRFPGVQQVACFDTAFHHDLPRVAKILPIPRSFETQGVRRYGFHGLSYEYLMSALKEIDRNEAKGRIIMAHLGSGASLAAVLDGKPMDTTMSFTPAAGVPMGTRSGDLDPGLMWYLIQEAGLNAKEYHEMVNFQSGLLGISETSSDMEALLKIEATDTRAAEAIAVFCYEVKKRIGAFAAALGGLDTLVFTGGIGENAPAIRSKICADLKFMGIDLDENLNQVGASIISKKASPVTLRAMHTDEEWMIAKTLCRILNLE